LKENSRMSTPRTTPVLLSVTDACHQGRFSRQWLYHLFSIGALRPVKIGWRTYVLASEVEPIAARRRAA
jgi:hypothetical protein